MPRPPLFQATFFLVPETYHLKLFFSSRSRGDPPFQAKLQLQIKTPHHLHFQKNIGILKSNFLWFGLNFGSQHTHFSKNYFVPKILVSNQKQQQQNKTKKKKTTKAKTKTKQKMFRVPYFNLGHTCLPKMCLRTHQVVK